MRALGASRISVVPGGALVAGWARNELWRRARAVPSLDLRFADNKSLTDATTGQNLITFTRASSGTYVDSQGVIRTATTNEARFDHNPTTGESLGLLVEEQRPNLLMQSEDLSTTWTVTRSTVSTNAIAAPSGLTVADKLVEDTTATNTHFAQQSISVTTGTVYTFSVYAKAAERNFTQLVLNGQFASVISAIFDLSTGSVGTTTGSPVTSAVLLPNGWWRLSITATTNATGATLTQIRVSNSSTTATYTGDGTSGIYLWGAQLEAGSFPTSYIPTTTAAVTRSADVASITGANFSSWYNQSEGTVHWEGSRSTTTGFPDRFRFSDGTSANRFFAYWDATNNSSTFEITTNSVGQMAVYGGQGALNAPLKSAFGIALNNGAVAYGGSIQGTDASLTIPSVSQVIIGNGFSGRISRLTYWPTRLANPTLQAITQ